VRGAHPRRPWATARSAALAVLIAASLSGCGSTPAKRGVATPGRAQSAERQFCGALKEAFKTGGSSTPATAMLLQQQLEGARRDAAVLVASSPTGQLRTDSIIYEGKVAAYYSEAAAARFSPTHPYPAGLAALGASVRFYSQVGPWAEVHCPGFPKDVGLNVGNR